MRCKRSSTRRRRPEQARGLFRLAMALPAYQLN